MSRAVSLTLLFAALTVAMAAPWSLHPASRVLVDAPDTHLFMWTLAWDAHAFATNPLGIFDANIFHPDRNTLAYSENLIGSAFFAAPIIWLTGDLVLAMNVVAMLTCMLCGLGAYFLSRTLGLSVAAAVMAGLIFAFDPTRFFRMSQLHLTAVQWVPFGLAFMHRYFQDGRARDLRLAMAFLVLQALTGGHGAVFLLVSMVLLTLYQLARRMPFAPIKRIRDFGIPGALLLVPAMLVWIPYRRAQVEMGLRRSLENWTVTPESFAASPSHFHQWVVSLFTDARVNEAASAYLFPGYLPVVLALIAIVPAGAARIRDRRMCFYALLALVSVLLFISPPLSLWPAVYWLPVLNFIRATSRFMILTTLAIAVLAAYGFDRLTMKLPSRARTVAALTAGALLLGEFSAHPFQGVDHRFEVPAIDRWLDTQPKPFVVAELPTPSPRQSGPFERHQTRAMLHSSAHWQRTIHGYSGLRSAKLDEATMALTRFPDEDSLKALRDLGVTHVVVHSELYSPEQWTMIEGRLASIPQLQLVRIEGSGQAYRLTPR